MKAVCAGGGACRAAWPFRPVVLMPTTRMAAPWSAPSPAASSATSSARAAARSRPRSPAPWSAASSATRSAARSTQRDRELARQAEFDAWERGLLRPSGALAQSRQRPLRRGHRRRALQARRHTTAATTCTGSTSTAVRRPCAAPPAAIPTAPGPRSPEAPALARHRRSRFLPPRPNGRGGFHFEPALPEVALHSKALTELAFHAITKRASYAAPRISPPPRSALLPHCQTSEICYKTNVLNLEGVVDA